MLCRSKAAVDEVQTRVDELRSAIWSLIDEDHLFFELSAAVPRCGGVLGRPGRSGRLDDLWSAFVK